MGITFDGVGLQGTSRIGTQAKDLSSMLMMVNMARMEQTASALMGQLDELQDNNLKMEQTNDAMSFAKTLLASFPACATSADPIPTGEALKNFKAAATEMGMDISKITNKGELSAEIENLKSSIDTSSRTQQVSMLRTQSWTNSYNETVSMTTNHLKSDHDTKSSIVGNMRT